MIIKYLPALFKEGCVYCIYGVKKHSTMSNNYLGRDNPDVLRAAHAGETLGLSLAEVAKSLSKVLAMHSLSLLQLGMPYQSKQTVSQGYHWRICWQQGTPRRTFLHMVLQGNVPTETDIATQIPCWHGACAYANKLIVTVGHMISNNKAPVIPLFYFLFNEKIKCGNALGPSCQPDFSPDKLRWVSRIRRSQGQHCKFTISVSVMNWLCNRECVCVCVWKVKEQKSMPLKQVHVSCLEPRGH